MIAEIRAVWLEHHVLAFPAQSLTDDDLERFTLYFGPFGDDPFIAPIEGREHVIAISRDADETSPLFAENWHTDWSFQERPPAGTCLYGITIPPHGGDTMYANQHAALDAMPADLRERLDGKLAVHSARGGYAPSGVYGTRPQAGRTMDIRPPTPRRRPSSTRSCARIPETGRLGLFGCLGYVIGIEGIDDDEERELLGEWYGWQTREEFWYQHRWEPGMLVMWDNRSVLHRATGGYEGTTDCCTARPSAPAEPDRPREARSPGDVTRRVRHGIVGDVEGASPVASCRADGWPVRGSEGSRPTASRHPRARLRCRSASARSRRRSS